MNGRAESLKINFGWSHSVEPVYQNEDAECGLACIAMLATFNGVSITLKELRTSSSNARGSSLTNLRDIASRLGLVTRPLRLEIDEFSNVKTPCIAHINGNHFVLVEKVGRHFSIIDPAVGRRKISKRHFGGMFTGVVLEVVEVQAKKQNLPRQRDSATSIHQVLGKPKRFKATVVLLFILSMFVEFTVLAIPALMQVVVDQSTLHSSTALLAGLVMCFCAVMLVQMSATFCRTWATTRFVHEQGTAWGFSLFSKMLRLPYQYFVGRGIGTIRTNFESLENVKTTLSTAVVTMIVDTLMAVLCLVILFKYSSNIAVVVLVGIAVYLAVRAISYNFIRESSIDLISLRARETSVFVETVKSIDTLRANNSQSNQARRYYDALTEIARKSAKMESMTLTFGSVSIGVSTLVKSIIIYYGIILIDGGALTTGMLVAFLAYSDQFVGRVGRVVDAILDFRILDVHLQRLGDIALNPEERIPRVQVDLERIERIDLVACSFRYSEGLPWVLADFNAYVRSGEAVGVMGPSGSGKSTLVRILNGTLDVSHGSLLINGVDAGLFSPDQIRRRIGTVSQGDMLLTGTIAENISSFDADVDELRLATAARAAQIDLEIDALPMKYSTRISDGTAQLSGGQLQRLCIARAIYSQPDIIVLDEGTANVDQATERKIISSIRELGFTLILITHRESATAYMDRLQRIEPNE